MRRSLTVARVGGLLAVPALLSGCGAGAKAGTPTRANTVIAAGSCHQAVLTSLAAVLGRIYREGIQGERTTAAERMIHRSRPLRAAVEAGDARAARAAVAALLASGHITDLRVSAGGRVLASAGPAALTPVQGTLKGKGGRTIGTYVYSVWSDSGFIAESSGVAEGLISLRRGERTVGGSTRLPSRPLPAEGSASLRGARYDYTSFPARAFPGGAPLTVYLLKTGRTINPLCGPTGEDTVVNTISGVARRIYQGEGGRRTQRQMQRVQSNLPLLRAVAAQDPLATRNALAALLHHHVVRLRVNGPHGVLSDVGGPYVLAPVRAPLTLAGKRLGSVVLSIQDDEGYLRLARRLVGLRVLMYMSNTTPSLVKNSLGPGVGGLDSVPATGRYVYRGQTYRVFTIAARAFPSGPLTIRVLIPMPYS